MSYVYPPDPDLVVPPTGDELPYEDGLPMESPRHRAQMEALISALEYHFRDRTDVFVGGNMFLYYDLAQVRNNHFKGPDVLLVLGAEPRERKSWVVWEEGGRTPDLVVELTSPSTAAEDRGPKKFVYGGVLGVPHYVLYEPGASTFEVYTLSGPSRDYRRMRPDAAGRVPLPRLGLEVGLSEGVLRGSSGTWLRLFTPAGDVIPHDAERADHAEERAGLAEQRAAALESELAELRRRLAGPGDHGPNGG